MEAPADLRRETGRDNDRFELRDHFVDERRSRTVLYFSSTDMGRRVPDPAEDDAQSEVSEWIAQRAEKSEEGEG